MAPNSYKNRLTSYNLARIVIRSANLNGEHSIVGNWGEILCPPVPLDVARQKASELSKQYGWQVVDNSVRR